ncbi:hypothetical protein P154DRAFT_623804 [Amniculicola lignicola CBS 123094]|uniref:Sin3-associated polypeptide Sap18 n=1 Tax=Amniculicola lignicola CBS 123094 TaxID=1392246 RepID=A0A6A5W9E1_9PLEO|nr:hypothetical protein P154DRAFT_623804 [Amniculicola lignicola CBS 123094]
MAAQVDRQTTTPFLLRLFYKQGAFHRLEEFTPHGRLPQHLQIYTWPTCTLSELSHLLLTALPSLLPPQYAGTRIAFRIVHPDMSVRGNAPGRYIGRDLGSVVVGASTSPEDAVHKEKDHDGDVDMTDGTTNNGTENSGEKKDEAISLSELKEALKDLSGEPQKALSMARFVIGDYICCAVLPPLADGSVAAAPPPIPSGPSARPPPRDGFGGARGGGPRGGSNGYRGDGYRGGVGGGDGQRGGRPGAGIGYDDWRREGGGGVPSGEWRRGEAPPEGYWRGGSTDGRLGPPGGGGGRGGGRGRGRW